MKTNRYSGFYKLPVRERLREVAEFSNLTKEEEELIIDGNSLDLDIADKMIENVIGKFTLPFAVALNFIINGKEYLIPMVTEEASVVAAASNAARLARETGGFFASTTDSIMIAQIQLVGVKDPNFAKMVILDNREKIKEICNEKDPYLVQHGGGFVDLEVRVIESIQGQMVIIHLKVDTLDAMGANAVNTMAEAVAPFIEEITGGKVYLRILSNLAVHRLARSRVTISKEALGGEEVVDGIVLAYAFAEADPFRAATHNKGIMNGITSVVLATGNDTRAVEAGAHAYAAITGRYTSLTTWEKNKEGNLVGTIEVPLAVGLVGGATKIHPIARLAIKILGVSTARQLAEVIASVGLAQNLAALRALATEGIQKGHMALHARNVASVAGAKGELLDRLVEIMVREKMVNVEYAKELMKKLDK
ncbi:MAG: hydroxymethylglutaryl-CoA reductase, degradative [Tissierellia bacterium]|nr:hydroxymethylglutaryl-CoA reductase, degradative [Tissierellia bacterium]